MAFRELKAKQLLKIFKGDDLEFRIVPYSFRSLTDVTISEAHIPYSLTFFNSRFSSLFLDACRVSGKMSFSNCQFETICIEGSDLQEITFHNCRIKRLVIKESKHLKKVELDKVICDKVRIESNAIYQKISVGCGSEIKSGEIKNNGLTQKSAYEAEIYFCPENFEHFEIKNNETEILEVGTFGEYAELKIQKNTANNIIFTNCDPDTSNVKIEDIKPASSKESRMKLVNSAKVNRLIRTNELSQYRLVNRD